ncbi:unnamed protein product [Echinostoma caproni]|uniref:Rad60-SLD_2 domain-containing protein n=1 Tax=Echinostoma caproni TaxID=27848 RepID=A0A183A0G2_9TREM|nr:unnamed protein product [Echinostoma caproni]
MYQFRLYSTDAALRLDPCTGMKLVEKVDTAIWLACATELSQLCRMKTEKEEDAHGPDTDRTHDIRVISTTL